MKKRVFAVVRFEINLDKVDEEPMTRKVMVMVMNLDKVDKEPDDKEGDGPQDVEEGEFLPCSHLGSNTKFTWKHSFTFITQIV